MREDLTDLIPDKEEKKARLQFHLQRISLLKLNLAKNAYQLGKELKEIKKEDDWRKRKSDRFTEYLHAIGFGNTGWTFISLYENFSEEEITRIGEFKAIKLIPILKQSDKLKPELLQIAESHSRDELKLALAPYREKFHLPDLHYKLLLTGAKNQLDHINQMIETLRDTKEFGETKASIIENILTETLEEITR